MLLAWSKPSCSKHNVLGCVRCWIILTFHWLGPLLTWGMHFSKGEITVPEQVLKRNPVPSRQSRAESQGWWRSGFCWCAYLQCSEAALHFWESSKIAGGFPVALNSFQCSVPLVLWHQGVFSVLLESCAASHPGICTHRTFHLLLTFFQLLGTTLPDYKPSFPAVILKSLQYVGISVEFLKRVGQISFFAEPSLPKAAALQCY